MKTKTKYLGIAYALIVGLGLLANQTGLLPQLQGDFTAIRDTEMGMKEVSVNCMYEDRARLFDLKVSRFYRGNILVVDPNASRVFGAYSKAITLQDAVNAAVSGDRIYVCPGMHSSRADIETKDLLISGMTNDPADTILTGFNKQQGINALNSELEMQYITMKDNSAHDQSGGAIYLFEGELQLDTMIFDNNVTRHRVPGNGSGGAIYAQASDVFVEESEFLNNSSDGSGGAITVYYGGLDVLDVDFSANMSNESGGAIYYAIHPNFSDPLEISYSEFEMNQSRDTAGAVSVTSLSSLEVSGPYVFLDNNLFKQNKSDLGGALTSSYGVSDTNSIYIENEATSGFSGALSAYGESIFNGVLFKDNLSFIDSTVDLSVENGGIEMDQCIFDGNRGRALRVAGDSNSNLLISNTLFNQNNSVSRSGGAAYISSIGEVNIDTTSFLDNWAVAGAAVWLQDVEVFTADTLYFEKNNARNHGGAILATDVSDLTVQNTDFLSNSANSMGGGAIYYEKNSSGSGQIVINNNNFLSNLTTRSSSLSGAIALIDYSEPLTPMTAEIKQNSFETNVGSGYGAVYLQDMILDLQENTFDSNESQYGSGGAIGLNMDEMYSSSIHTLINNTFSNNVAAVYGGAIRFANWSESELDSNTFYYNSAGQGGGALFSGANDDVNLLNNLFEGNQSINGPTCLNSTTEVIVSSGYNISNDETCDFDHETDVQNTLDPMVDSVLVNNGGPTKTHAVLSTGPAFETGTCSQSTDQRGYPRVSDCDRGAYED